MIEKIKHEFLNTSVDDYLKLLNLASKLKKLKEKDQKAIRVAVIGTSSLQMIVTVLEAMLFCDGIACDIYEGEFNGIAMDVFDPASPMYEFRPEIIVILPDIHSISEFPATLQSNEQVMESAAREADSFINLFSTIHRYLPDTCILCSNIPINMYSPLGNAEANCLFSESCYTTLVNLDLLRKRPNYVTFLDIRKLSEQIGALEWYDPASYFVSKQGFNLKYIGYFCNLIKKQIEALKGKVKKCLVLDLDNTIWGGAVGDLGCEGIVLEPNDAEGEAYLVFQKYIVSLKNRGVIIAVCSKNDMKNAIEPFEKNPYMILKKEDISCFVANWEDKVTNIKYIAQYLNIGTDSMVFFDDNPTERTLVKEFLPEVEVIDVPEDPAFYVRNLDMAHAFDWTQITNEDINRTKTYLDVQKREQLRLNYNDYNEYLSNLEMTGCFEKISDKAIDRFVQLLNKTNQFNLMTNRYSEAQIIEMKKDDRYALCTVSLSDRFSQYGIIACVILYFEEDKCQVVDWCMSCRVLKKSVENYILTKIIELCSMRGVKTIQGSYRRTAKNGIVSDLYKKLGFAECTGNSDDLRNYYLPENLYPKAGTEHFIREECNNESRRG